MRARAALAVALALALAGNGACGKADKGEGPGPATAKVPTPAAQDPTIAAYDVLRESLAQDDLNAAKGAAERLAASAAKDWPTVATAAKPIAAAPDLAAARIAFGDASRALIAALADKPTLAQGVVAFRCPMAKGYQKWVQLTPPLRNPYMGQEMLDCGSKADLTP